MKTKTTRKSDIKREWHLIDAKDKIVGRLAGEAAPLLMGKNKTYFVPHLDCGDYVVVINANHVKFTGNKETNKMYYRHSGYPGGFKQQSAAELREKKGGSEIVKKAVKGMVPRGRLGNAILKKLFVYDEETHPHKEIINGK